MCRENEGMSDGRMSVKEGCGMVGGVVGESMMGGEGERKRCAERAGKNEGMSGMREGAEGCERDVREDDR